MSEIESILKKYPRNESSLIQVLQDVHRVFNYLPLNALKEVARELNVPLAKVYGVATFYRAFSLKPRGEKIIKVCMGTACHIRGAQQLVEEFERHCHVKSGETSKDKKYTLETVNCVGACAMAPVVIVNETYHGNAKAANVKEMIGEKRHARKN